MVASTGSATEDKAMPELVEVTPELVEGKADREQKIAKVVSTGSTTERALPGLVEGTATKPVKGEA